MARDRQRDDLAAEVSQTVSAAKATTTSIGGQNGKAAVTHNGRSQRSNREAIQQHEERQRDLITALTDLGGPVQHDLAGRLHRCRQARNGRRVWSNHGGTASSAYPYQCRLFACWACRRSIIRHWEDKARRQFVSAANSACTVISISLSSTTKIDDIGGTVAKARKDLGNMRAAAYQQPGGWRWRSVQVFGIVGIDAATLDHAALLTPARPALIPSFWVTTPVGNPLWMLRASLAVHHPHLDRAELAQAIMHQWPGSGRVVVQRFEDQQSAADNAAAVVADALENVGRAGSNAGASRLAVCREATFYAWLFDVRRGLQPLGISLRPQVLVPSVGCTLNGTVEQGFSQDAWISKWVEPMPILF